MWYHLPVTRWCRSEGLCRVTTDVCPATGFVPLSMLPYELDRDRSA